MGDFATGDYITHGLATLLTITPWQANSVAYVGIALDAPFAPDNEQFLADEPGCWMSLIAWKADFGYSYNSGLIFYKRRYLGGV